MEFLSLSLALTGLVLILWQMWMKPPRRRSRTSWSSTTGPCWLLIHVAASPRSSVDLELVPATRSLTVNCPVHFLNKLEEDIFSSVLFFILDPNVMWLSHKLKCNIFYFFKWNYSSLLSESSVTPQLKTFECNVFLAATHASHLLNNLLKEACSK